MIRRPKPWTFLALVKSKIIRKSEVAVLRILFINAVILATLTPAFAGQSVRYCYNCVLNERSRIAAPVPVYPRQVITTVYPAPSVPVYPAPTVAYAPGYGSVPLPPASRCWLQPDPYTFLGEIFGYDYIYICQ